MPTPVPNIWQLQSRGDTEALAEALHHPDASVRRGAAAALRVLGAWQTVPALEAALAAEHDWQAHAAITAAIKYLDRDVHIETMVKNQDVRGLAKMLMSPQVEDTLIACEALSQIGNKQAVEPLVMVFRNPSSPSKVRLAAAEALLKLESAPAVVTLLGALRRDDWQVRRNAAAVLGQLQASWATEPLIKALEDDNQVVRRTAAAALRRIGSTEATQAAAAFEEAQRRSAGQPAQPPTPQPVQAQPAAPVSPVAAVLHSTSQISIPTIPKPATGPLSPSETKPMFAALPRPGAAPTDSKPAVKATGPLAGADNKPSASPAPPDSQTRIPTLPPPLNRPGGTGLLPPLPGSETKPVIPAIPKPPPGPPGSPDPKRSAGTRSFQELQQIRDASSQSTPEKASPPTPVPEATLQPPAPVAESKPDTKETEAEIKPLEQPPQPSALAAPPPIPMPPPAAEDTTPIFPPPESPKTDSTPKQRES